VLPGLAVCSRCHARLAPRERHSDLRHVGSVLRDYFTLVAGTAVAP
jgi:hypothetical protein